MDRYGDPLPAGALVRLGTVRFRAKVIVVSFLPDGKTFASAGADAVRLWDLKDGKVLKEFKGTKPYLEALAVSPDGKVLAAGGFDQPIILWNLISGQELRKLTVEPVRYVRALAFSPDGKTLAALVENRSPFERPIPCHVWEVGTGKELDPRTPDQDGRRWVPLVDNKLAYLTKEQVEQLGAITTSEGYLRVLRPEEPEVGPHSVAFSPDGKLYAVQYQDRVMRIWDLASGKRLRELTPPREGSSTAGHLVFSRDGTKLASSFYTPIQIWDVTTGKKLRQLEGNSDVACLTFSPDNKILVWCDGGVHLREVETGKEPYHFEGHDEPVDFLAFSGDGKTLTSSAWDHTVRIWDSMTGKPIKRFPIPRPHFGGTSALSKDGKTLAFTPDVNSICLWDVERGKQAVKIKKAKHYASYLSFLPDGKTLISFGEGGTYFWEIATGKEARHLDRGFGGAFSPDGATVAEEVLIYPDDEVQVNKILLLDMRTGEKRAEFASPGGVRPLVFSPDGKSLAAGDARIWFSCFSRPTVEDQTLRVFEVPRGKQKVQFRVPHEGISVIAFSPDGKMLACGDRQGTICLFDLKTRQELVKLQGHSNVISHLVFSPDGKALASGSYDTTVLVWDVNKLKK